MNRNKCIIQIQREPWVTNDVKCSFFNMRDGCRTVV